MQIAIQGALGSFHHEAARHLEPRASIVSKQDFADVFNAVRAKEVDYGLCAIENTLYGPIHDVYHLLEDHDIWIIRDIQLQIAQHLIGPSTVSLHELAASSDVRVLSQAPALAQAEHWLALHLPHATIETTHDTAASVMNVVKLGKPHTLAIAGRLAATTYGGTIVAENIQDNPENYTRFILFSRDRQPVSNATAGSILLETSDRPDSLTTTLQVFTDTNSKLIRIQSSLSQDKRHQYRAHVDYELPISGSASIIEKLQMQGCTVRLLGEYSSSPLIHTL